MASIKGTRTEVNLLTTFAGESQARNRYTFFASVAKKEGFILISEIFTETANQEKEHAERMFKFLEGGTVEIKAAYPAGVIGKTLDNLLAAAGGEYEEWHDLYPAFAKIARAEGFEDIAQMYEKISVAEAFHEKRYRAFADLVKNGTMFKRETPVKWRCRNCGFTFEGTEAPALCPACLHPRDYFELLVLPW